MLLLFHHYTFPFHSFFFQQIINHKHVILQIHNQINIEKREIYLFSFIDHIANNNYVIYLNYNL